MAVAADLHRNFLIPEAYRPAACPIRKIQSSMNRVYSLVYFYYSTKRKTVQLFLHFFHIFDAHFLRRIFRRPAEKMEHERKTNPQERKRHSHETIPHTDLYSSCSHAFDRNRTLHLRRIT